MMKTYSEMILLSTFEERIEYLKMPGIVGMDTFGYDRYINQIFYKSDEWESVRRKVLLRDNCCDLGIDGYDIFSKAIIHHMNPITKEQILDRDPMILNPEYLITVSSKTHRYIHYGCTRPELFAARTPGDTKLWGNG